MTSGPFARRLAGVVAIGAGCLLLMGPGAVSASPSYRAFSASPPSRGYRLYVSKVLPYNIEYAPGWTADGSVWGTSKRPEGEWYDADAFGKKLVGSILIEAEGLPPGSLLTSEAYQEAALLDLQRGYEGDPTRSYTATRLGTMTVDGTKAYILDYTVGTGDNALPYTVVYWVEKGRGWRAVLSTVWVGARHNAEVPVFETMVRTFHET